MLLLWLKLFIWPIHYFWRPHFLPLYIRTYLNSIFRLFSWTVKNIPSLFKRSPTLEIPPTETARLGRYKGSYGVSVSFIQLEPTHQATCKYDPQRRGALSFVFGMGLLNLFHSTGSCRKVYFVCFFSKFCVWDLTSQFISFYWAM